MTMYLPNPGVGPTGFEAGEFIEVPPMSDPAAQPPCVAARDDRPQPPTREDIAYLPVRVTRDRRADDSVRVYLLNGTALDVSERDLLQLEPGSEPRPMAMPSDHSADHAVLDEGAIVEAVGAQRVT